MAADFLTALRDFWAATPALAAISPELYLGVAPASRPYPFAVITQVAGRTAGLNTGKGYWQVRTYQVALFHADEATSIADGDTVEDTLAAILDSPLSFSDGYQMQFVGAGRDRLRAPGLGRAGVQVFMSAHGFHATIGKVRP